MTPEEQHYIALVYGRQSELKFIDKIEERKKAALARSGLKEAKGLEQEIMRYLITQNDLKYSLLVSRQEMYWETLSKLRNQIVDATDTDEQIKIVKLKKELDQLSERLMEGIAKLYREIFESADIIDAAKEHTKVTYSPEQRIKK